VTYYEGAVSAPHFTILTQQEIPLNLSRPAMEVILGRVTGGEDVQCTADVRCEVDNFRNLLQNLLERSEPEPGNMDLIGG
jgi:hypothetical protein